MWIGAAADHGGVRPDYVNLFDKTKTFQEKTEDLVSNLDNEGERSGCRLSWLLWLKCTAVCVR